MLRARPSPGHEPEPDGPDVLGQVHGFFALSAEDHAVTGPEAARPDPVGFDVGEARVAVVVERHELRAVLVEPLFESGYDVAEPAKALDQELLDVRRELAVLHVRQCGLERAEDVRQRLASLLAELGRVLVEHAEAMFHARQARGLADEVRQRAAVELVDERQLVLAGQLQQHLGRQRSQRGHGLGRLEEDLRDQLLAVRAVAEATHQPLGHRRLFGVQPLGGEQLLGLELGAAHQGAVELQVVVEGRPDAVRGVEGPLHPAILVTRGGPLAGAIQEDVDRPVDIRRDRVARCVVLQPGREGVGDVAVADADRLDAEAEPAGDVHHRPQRAQRELDVVELLEELEQRLIEQLGDVRVVRALPVHFVHVDLRPDELDATGVGGQEGAQPLEPAGLRSVLAAVDVEEVDGFAELLDGEPASPGGGRQCTCGVLELGQIGGLRDAHDASLGILAGWIEGSTDVELLGAAQDMSGRVKAFA